jgi:hypothetical protein
MSIRSIIVLAGVLCLAPLAVLTAQQSSDTTGTAAPATQATAASPSAGPRVSPQFQRAEPTLAPSSAAQRSAFVYHKAQHTIVISTVVLVLAVIILVLLIAR